MKNYNFATFVAIAILFILVGINTFALFDIFDVLSDSNGDTDKKSGTIVGNVGSRSSDVFPNDLAVREYILTRPVTFGHDPSATFLPHQIPKQIPNPERKDNSRSLQPTASGASELADDLTSIDGVVRVTLDYNKVTIDKSPDYKWDDIEPLALSLIKAFEDENLSSSARI